MAKNVETALEKMQSTKRKAVLSSINPAPKKKQRIEEKSETIIKSEPDSGNSSEPKILLTLTNKDKAKSERSIKDKSNVAKQESGCLIRLYQLLTIFIIYICVYQDSKLRF